MRLRAVLGGGAALVLLGFGAAAASFSDRVMTAGEVTAASLPAPEMVAVSLTGDLSAASVSWQSAPGDFATGWQLARRTGPCEGWTPLADALLSGNVTAPHIDSAVETGTRYCYAVRGTFANWLSPFSIPSAAAEVYVPAITRLFTHAASPDALRTTPGTGSHRFGCLASVLGICTSSAPSSYTFTSTVAYTLFSSSGWQASLRLESPTAAAAGSVTLTLHAWYVDGACGSVPMDGSLIATGARTVTVPLLGTINGTYPITLTANPGFVAPDAPGTLCMRVHSSDPSVLGLLFHYDLVHGADSWLEGPVEP